MKIAWTTTETIEQARQLAKLAVENDLAACAQISSPVTSIYVWKGQTEESQEFRVTFKLRSVDQPALQNLILSNHPYETPQWVVAELSDVSPAYEAWAEGGKS